MEAKKHTAPEIHKGHPDAPPAAKPLTPVEQTIHDLEHYANTAPAAKVKEGDGLPFVAGFNLKNLLPIVIAVLQWLASQQKIPPAPTATAPDATLPA